MTIPLNTQKYLVLSNYLDSLWTHKPEKFKSLLSPEVELVHYTNEKKDYEESGRDRVVELFMEKFFSKLVSINVKSVEINPKKPEYTFISIQEMVENGSPTQIKYHDHTTFELVKVDNVLVISKIIMNITKTRLFKPFE